TMRGFAERFTPAGLREDALHPCYGLAEATLMVTGQFDAQGVRYAHFDPEGRVANEFPGQGRGSPLIACGSTPDCHVINIVDPETGLECSSNQIGEIWFGGPSVASGYWRRPVETSETFNATLPRCGNQRFLRTGDLGLLQSGELFVC